MLYISIFLIVSLILIYILSLRYKDQAIFNKLDKKEHKLYMFYPMAEFLLDKTKLGNILNKPETVRKVRSLYILDQRDNQVRLYLYKKISLVIFVVFMFLCFSLILSCQYVLNDTDHVELSSVLTRPDTMEDEESIRLKFRMTDKAGNKVAYEDEIVIQNPPRKLTQEEWNEILKEAVFYLEQEVLGENESLDQIYSDLNFIESIPKTSIKVEWIPEDYRLISNSGKVENSTLTQSVKTTVTAVLKCQDMQKEHTIPLTIWPKVKDERNILFDELLKSIEKNKNQTVNETEWALPNKLGDYIIEWEKPKDDPSGVILVAGLTVSILIWFLMDKDLDSKVKHRNNQMLQDYPEIINKFSLLVNAGMTIKQAWFNIAEDYIRKKEVQKSEIRYAYEEMTATLYELKLGIPESQAYEQFGQRTGLLPYIKFSSCLVQNLKKGNKDMVSILKIEAMEAFHERKATAKKLGEEASTKLLGPMAIMLLIVFAIIMIPAFLSFGF